MLKGALLKQLWCGFWSRIKICWNIYCFKHYLICYSCYSMCKPFLLFFVRLCKTHLGISPYCICTWCTHCTLTALNCLSFRSCFQGKACRISNHVIFDHTISKSPFRYNLHHFCDFIVLLTFLVVYHIAGCSSYNYS